MDHKELNTWKLAVDLVESIYILTREYPQNETFGLTSQMRRAATSIPSNIAEGAGRDSDKEFIHFLFISLGSRAELETQIIISERLNYITPSKSIEIQANLIRLRKSLLGLIKYLKNKP